MMKVIQKKTCVVAVLAAMSVPAFAAGEQVDLKVTGKITPAACTPTLSDSATVDYGNISPNILSQTKYTLLPLKQIDLTINCTGLANIAFTVVNGRPGTAAGTTEGTGGFGNSPIPLEDFNPGLTWGVAGLGTADSKNIGGYGLLWGHLVADTKPADPIIQYNDEKHWENNPDSVHGYTPFGANWKAKLTVAANGKTEPLPFRTLTGKLSIQAYLNKTSELDVSKDIELNGLTTIKLVYL